MEYNNIEYTRSHKFAKNVIVVDGQAGCGKTLFSSIISSLNRVELLTYAFDVEFICKLAEKNKISKDASESLIQLLIDNKLYQLMMGRETNFRYSDLSSVFNNPFPIRYFKRLFQKGDEYVNDIVNQTNPIMNFATHDLISYSLPLINTLKESLTFFEVVRHPLYTIIQQALNMQRLLNNPRDIQLQIKYKDKNLPYFTEGWEDLFIKSNYYEKSIHMINFFTEKRKTFNIDHFNMNKSKYLEICFERFVKKPDLYIEKIINLSNTKYTNKTKKYLKKNKIPRDKFSDGIPLNVYKRSGWKPPKKYLSEKDELYERRKIVENNNISEFGLDILDKLCKEYEQKYKIEELF